jgi:hypothetical protein
MLQWAIDFPYSKPTSAMNLCKSSGRNEWREGDKEGMHGQQKYRTSTRMLPYLSLQSISERWREQQQSVIKETLFGQQTMLKALQKKMRSFNLRPENNDNENLR